MKEPESKPSRFPTLSEEFDSLLDENKRLKAEIKKLSGNIATMLVRSSELRCEIDRYRKTLEYIVETPVPAIITEGFPGEGWRTVEQLQDVAEEALQQPKELLKQTKS